MKALILAAGLGTRLRPLTNDRPKSMIEVNGTPILLKQIENLMTNGINDIIVVAGYKSEIITSVLKKLYPTIQIIVNNNYNKTNNMYSAYLAKDILYNTDFLLMNADVFFDSSIIQEVMDPKYDNAIVVEENIYNEENMKVIYIDERIRRIGKTILKEDSSAVSIDLYKFSAKGSIAFFDKTIEYIEEKQDVNQWTEVAINDILSEIHFKPCRIKGRWIEIDDYNDLKKAERMFK